MIRKITISGFIIFFQSLVGQESVFDEIELEFNSIIDQQQKEYDLYTEDVSVWKNNIDLSKTVVKPSLAKIDKTYNNVDSRTRVVIESKKYLGIPYIWGGDDPSGFDCSGYVQWVLKKTHNILIPRTTALQFKKWKHIVSNNINQLKIGDVIYFNTKQNTNVSHVGIFLGNNSFIHAPNRNSHVKVSKLEGYWKSKLVGYVDVFKITDATVTARIGELKE